MFASNVFSGRLADTTFVTLSGDTLTTGTVTYDSAYSALDDNVAERRNLFRTTRMVGAYNNTTNNATTRLAGYGYVLRYISDTSFQLAPIVDTNGTTGYFIDPRTKLIITPTTSSNQHLSFSISYNDFAVSGAFSRTATTLQHNGVGTTSTTRSFFGPSGAANERGVLMHNENMTLVLETGLNQNQNTTNFTRMGLRNGMLSFGRLTSIQGGIVEGVAGCEWYLNFSNVTHNAMIGPDTNANAAASHLNFINGGLKSEGTPAYFPMNLNPGGSPGTNGGVNRLPVLASMTCGDINCPIDVLGATPDQYSTEAIRTANHIGNIRLYANAALGIAFRWFGGAAGVSVQQPDANTTNNNNRPISVFGADSEFDEDDIGDIGSSAGSYSIVDTGRFFWRANNNVTQYIRATNLIINNKQMTIAVSSTGNRQAGARLQEFYTGLWSGLPTGTVISGHYSTNVGVPVTQTSIIGTVSSGTWASSEQFVNFADRTATSTGILEVPVQYAFRDQAGLTNNTTFDSNRGWTEFSQSNLVESNRARYSAGFTYGTYRYGYHPVITISTLARVNGIQCYEVRNGEANSLSSSTFPRDTLITETESVVQARFNSNICFVNRNNSCS